MKHFHARYTWIGLTSAVVAITMQNFAINNLQEAELIPQHSQLIGLIIRLTSASIIYIIIYKFLLKCYEMYSWKYPLHKYHIDGKWYHELKSNDPNYRRRGHTQFNQNMLSIALTGVNYSPPLYDGVDMTMWESNCVVMDENWIITFAYSATRTLPGSQKRPLENVGVMKGRITHDAKGRPTRIEGVFIDADPQRRGSIVWTRTADWQNEYEAALVPDRKKI